jgi:glycogen debranching enzyme
MMGDDQRQRGAVAAPLEIPLIGDTPIDVHPGLVLAYGGYTVLVARHDGSFEGQDDEGLFDYDTRILSRHVLRLNGQKPTVVADATPLHDRWLGHLRLALEEGTAEGPRLPEDNVEVTVWTRVGQGMSEHLQVDNHSMAPFSGTLSLELDADFADIQETDGRRQDGEISRNWDADARSLTFDYRAAHEGRTLHRALRVVVADADGPPECNGNTISFEVRLEPKAGWSAELRFESLVDGEWRIPPPAVDEHGEWLQTDRDRARDTWRAQRTHVETGHHLVAPAIERAADDLFALRNWELDVGATGWVPHAGVPSYTGLFGRDSLTAAWQALMLGPEIARGALEAIARTQSTEDDPWRDAEPDKMIHEIRRGPLAELGLTPHDAYYGTHTTPALFVLLLSEYWHWTADEDALRRYREPALRAMEWARRYGDLDGDGFLEYQPRSSEGLRNQAWKDSDEAIRHVDGRLADNPVATVEEQAFLCLALERMAEILLVLGEDEQSAEFRQRARDFRARWHDAFWMPDEQFYAMALDGEKQQVRSIGSNPGHALAAGIVPSQHAVAVADRLLAPDLFSGWGIRTLSSDHPSYNPYGYHLGPVWPVENATFALGFKRYGLDEHAERLMAAQFSAAAHFQGFRLPEVLGGHGRRDLSIPTVYPNSCSPQAWSASATIQLVQTALGIYPFAPAGVLALVRPRLPAWLESVTLRGLRVGEAVLSLHFQRTEDGSADFEVIDQEGALRVHAVPPPNDVGDEADDWSARLASWLLEHAPGRTARATRIALGNLDD